jgi:hypothetical protein
MDFKVGDLVIFTDECNTNNAYDIQLDIDLQFLSDSINI